MEQTEIKPRVDTRPDKAGWEEIFLEVLKRPTSSVRAACAAAHISRQAAYKERRLNPEFALAWDASIEDATDQLEEMALERAKTSDTMLIFMLKSRRDKFRERIYRLTDDSLDDEIRRLTERMGARAAGEAPEAERITN